MINEANVSKIEIMPWVWNKGDNISLVYIIE